MQITLAKEREGNIISICNGCEEWVRNGFMEVIEVQRQRLISVVPLWGFTPFCHHFIFACGRQKDPSVQPKMLYFPDTTLHKRSVRCVGGENWKKQATDRGNSSSLLTKTES